MVGWGVGLYTCYYYRMSFRETFTRSSSNSQHLRYDDTAAYHFGITILIILACPLAYSLLSAVLRPFSHIPQLDELQKKRHFRDKIARFKKENRHSYLTFKFVMKSLLLMGMLAAIVHSAQAILSSPTDMKGFDPYEILEIEQNAPIERVKKAYRKLALLYHPDRNQDNPEASAKFIMISKAYECLTDDQARQKCLKFGNPDGASSFNVGIALPSFLVRPQNHLAIMGVIFLLVVIVLPIYLIHYHSEMNKYDDFGMLAENQPLVNFSLNQQFSIRDAIKMVACCAEFASLATTRQQVDKLQLLLKLLDEDEKKALTKKNYKGFVKKALLLIDARVNEKAVPGELEEDYRFIMRTTPTILKSAVHAACERSVEYARSHANFFVGKNCIKSLLLFGQHFIQGRSYELSDSFTQLDLSDEEVDRIFKKKKQRRITDLAALIAKPEEREFMLGLLEPHRAAYIKECIEYFPTLELQSEVRVDEEVGIGAGDFFTVALTVSSNRTGSFCSAPTYPFLKSEGWHILVSDAAGQFIIFHEFFTFDTPTKSFKVTYRQEKQGKYALAVQVLSDCYFGLDLERDVKYEVGPARKVVEEREVEGEEKEEESYIRKIFNSLVPQEEEEVSDQEDNEKDKLKEKEKEGDNKEIKAT